MILAYAKFSTGLWISKSVGDLNFLKNFKSLKSLLKFQIFVYSFFTGHRFTLRQIFKDSWWVNIPVQFTFSLHILAYPLNSSFFRSAALFSKNCFCSFEKYSAKNYAVQEIRAEACLTWHYRRVEYSLISKSTSTWAVISICKKKIFVSKKDESESEKHDWWKKHSFLV